MEEERMGKRKARALETRNRIYESANRLFAEHGIDRVSVDSIVEKAGVSKGAFYLHFNSKNALVAAMIGDYVNQADSGYEAYLKSLPAAASESEVLMAVAAKIADVITSTLGYSLIKMVYEIQLSRSVNTGALWSYSRNLYHLFGEIIGRGIQRGEFEAELSADTIANHFIMGARGLTYEWCIRYPEFDLKDHLVKHFAMLLNGIRKQ